MKIDLNKWLKLEAKERKVRFVPYKENFVTPVDAGDTLWIKAKTVGQYLYYVKNGFVAAAEVGTGDHDIVVNVPATITIANNADKVMNFIPYRENFQVEVKPGESYEFEAETAGQVLYYMAQDTNGADATGGLDVKQEEVKA